MTALESTLLNKTLTALYIVHGLLWLTLSNKTLSNSANSVYVMFQLAIALESTSLNETFVLNLAEDLQNHTAIEYYRNPIDIAAVIDSVGQLVKAQVRV